MKTLKYLLTALGAVVLLASCAKADEEPIHTENAISYIQITPGGTNQYPVAGVINQETGEILFKVGRKLVDRYPTLKELTVSATVKFDAIITPSLTGLKNLETPFAITVTAGDGTKKEYTLEAYYSRD